MPTIEEISRKQQTELDNKIRRLNAEKDSIEKNIAIKREELEKLKKKEDETGSRLSNLDQEIADGLAKVKAKEDVFLNLVNDKNEAISKRESKVADSESELKAKISTASQYEQSATESIEKLQTVKKEFVDRLNGLKAAIINDYDNFIKVVEAV